MPFDFPNTPTVGQIVANGTIVYLWDGVKWVVAFGPLSEAPLDGQVYGRQGSTTSWVPTLPLTGGNLSGPLGVGAQGISYSWLGATGANIALTNNSGAYNIWQNGVAGPALATQNFVNSGFLPLSGGTGGPTTFSGAVTLSGGGTFTGTFAGSPTWSGLNVWTARMFAQGNLSSGTATASAADVGINGSATSARNLNIQAASVQRWQIGGANSGVSGTNADTDLTVGSYYDAGTFNNFMFKIRRASGPLGLGPPLAYDAGPIYLTHTGAVTAGGTVGHRILINDVQPTYPLAANPISTTSGSATVTIALPSAASVVSTNPPSWVNLQGVTAVGGITPTGWLRVQSIAANSFTVTWTSNATSTAASGGGSAVTISPLFPNSMIQNNYTQKSGSQGFNVMHSNIYNVDPSFQPLFADRSAGNSGWTMFWNVAASPNDPTGTYQTSILGEEMDILNRGPDSGYQPLIAAGVASLGKLYGPLWTVPNYITGGGVGGIGTPNHVNTMWTLFGNNGFPGTYVGLSIQPSALVGKGIDTVSNHGGVGFDLFGSYALLTAQNPFTTATGTSTITVKTTPTAAAAGQLSKQVNGGTVYIPNTYTISGVTFGGGTYVMGNVNDTTGSFTITGSGTAAGNVSGGGTFVVIYFTNLSPYAGLQLSGLWEDGIRTAALSRFTNGLIVHTQPGVGMGWDDGTGIASVNASAASAGNISVLLNAAGTGTINANAPIVLPAALPTTSNQAASKAYVDSRAVNIATTGSASVTGTTSETNLVALRIPGGVMGLNGTAHIHALWSYTSSTNLKTLQPRIGASAGITAGGTMAGVAVSTANQTSQTVWIVRNNNSQANQTVFNGSGIVPFSNTNAVLNPLTLNTANDWYVNLNGTLAVGTETITLVHAHVVVYPA